MAVGAWHHLPHDFQSRTPCATTAASTCRDPSLGSCVAPTPLASPLPLWFTHQRRQTWRLLTPRMLARTTSRSRLLLSWTSLPVLGRPMGRRVPLNPRFWVKGQHLNSDLKAMQDHTKPGGSCIALCRFNPGRLSSFRGSRRYACSVWWWVPLCVLNGLPCGPGFT